MQLTNMIPSMIYDFRNQREIMCYKFGSHSDFLGAALNCHSEYILFYVSKKGFEVGNTWKRERKREPITLRSLVLVDHLSCLMANASTSCLHNIFSLQNKIN